MRCRLGLPSARTQQAGLEPRMPDIDSRGWAGLLFRMRRWTPAKLFPLGYTSVVADRVMSRRGGSGAGSKYALHPSPSPRALVMPVVNLRGQGWNSLVGLPRVYCTDSTKYGVRTYSGNIQFLFSARPPPPPLPKTGQQQQQGSIPFPSPPLREIKSMRNGRGGRGGMG